MSEADDELPPTSQVEEIADKTPEQIAAEAVERYKAKLHDETQRRLVQSRMYRGMYDGRGSGPLPFGYERGPWNQVVIYEEQASLVRLIFRKKKAGRTLTQIAVELEFADIRTSRGGYWEESSIAAILAHEQLYREGIRTYAGKIASLRWPVIVAGDD